MIKAIILPVIISVITGIGSSYVAVNVTLAVIETRLNYVENDLVSLRDVLSAVSKMQNELARRGEWMVNTDRRIIVLENKAQRIDDDR